MSLVALASGSAPTRRLGARSETTVARLDLPRIPHDRTRTDRREPDGGVIRLHQGEEAPAEEQVMARR